MSVVSAKRPKKAKAPVQTELSREESVTNGSVASPEQLQQEVQNLEAELAKAEGAVAKLNSWDRDRPGKATAKVAELRGRLEMATLRAMPLPPATVSSLKFQERSIALATVRSTGNHREITDEAETIRLARTMTTVGLQQRVGVRDAGDGTFELIFGARRCAAARLNGWDEIPAKIYPPATTAAEVEILRTIENFGRKDLTHVERAIAVARTIDAIQATLDKGKGEPPTRVGPDQTPEESIAARKALNLNAISDRNPVLGDALRLQIAIDAAGGMEAYVGQQLGFPAKWVKDNAYVSQLGGKARELLAGHRIDVGHARELAKLGDKGRADMIAGSCARSENGTGGETVERCRQWVIEHLRSLKVVPWQLDVAFGKGVAGCTGYACSTCPFNSKTDPDLFGGVIADEPAAGVCTNETCFAAKQHISEIDIKKFVGKAQAEVKKRDVAVTETNLAHLVPLHVKPSSAVRKAKKVIEPAAPKESASSDSHRDAESKMTPEADARFKLEQAEGRWASEVNDLMFQSLEAKPVRTASLLLLGELFGWSGCDEGDLSDPEIETAINLASGDERDIAELAAILLKRERHLQIQILDTANAPDFYRLFIQRWGLEAKPRPMLEDFLPKPKPPTDPKPDKSRGGKTAAGEKSPPPLKGEPAEQLGVKLDDCEKSSVIEKLTSPLKKPISVKPVKLDGRQWVEIGGAFQGGIDTVDLLPLFERDAFEAKFGAKYPLSFSKNLDITDDRREAYTGVIVKVGKREMVLAPRGEARRILFKQPAPAEASGARAPAEAADGDEAERRCRVCGCTEDDCRGCIARLGHACWWVEKDLCSACVGANARAGISNRAPAVGQVSVA